MQFELVEVLLLLGARRLSLDNGLTRWVAFHEALVDGVEDGAFQLVMEVHGGLPFVADGVIVQQLLIGDAVELREGQQGNESLQPRAGEPVLAECDIAHGSLLVHSHPLPIVVAERVVGREFVEHYWVSFLRFLVRLKAHADEGSLSIRRFAVCGCFWKELKVVRIPCGWTEARGAVVR